jgi:hypothetical protein
MHVDFDDVRDRPHIPSIVLHPETFRKLKERTDKMSAEELEAIERRRQEILDKKFEEYLSRDWIGIHATPRASTIVDRLIEEEQNQDEKKELASVLIDYDVPMKDKSRPRLKASNWPKAYFVQSLSPCAPGQSRPGADAGALE